VKPLGTSKHYPRFIHFFMPTPHLPQNLQQTVTTGLLPWFSAHARDLPWRKHRTPYRIWISEAMLQQTRVDTVIPYFEAWMRQFPSIEVLANADQQAVLKVWEGLGYYSRARNIHRAARILLEEFDGQVPSDQEALRALPGIGPYTSAAILSLAFGKPYAVLDGNVERVLTRLLAWDANVRSPKVKSALQSVATRMLGDHPPGLFNEAVMELGATVCMPKKADCPRCPLHNVCRAARGGSPEQFPYKSKAKAIPTIEVGAGLVWRDPETFLIAQRKQDGMLGGLWEFPGGKVEAGESMQECIQRELMEELGIAVDVGPRLVHVRHTYSHFHLRMDVHHCLWKGPEPRALDCAGFRWVQLSDCGALPFSRADLKVLEALEAPPSNLFL
jgi:A/G-specific adenine glycosylase